MARPVVDALEFINVEIHDSERAARAPCPRAFDLEGGFERSSIEKTGQAVGARQRFERPLIAANFVHQRGDGDAAHYLGDPAARRCVNCS